MEKKTSVIRSADMLDGHMLAQRYEALRRDVVTDAAGNQDVRALALFVRRGMAAWMGCISERGTGMTSVTSPIATAQSYADSNSMARTATLSIEQPLINIVVAMTRAHVKEVFA
jgi:hypothetical protein